jgi:hypothetical protein
MTTTITPLPTPPTTTDPTTFNSRANAFLGALPTFVTQANAVATETSASASAAASSAAAALASQNAAAASETAAGASANATKWTNIAYSVGDARYSPINFQTYRRKIAGTTNTDPSNDPTNWASTVLPSHTGNAGKFLTNDGGSVDSWSYIPGVGGTTLTGNTTLIVTSPASMVVTPATPGLYAALPDSTTLTKGISQFSIYNAGEYDYGVKDSSGTVLGWVRPQTGGVLGLADNATTAGIWNLTNIEKLGNTAIYRSEAGITNGTAPRLVTIDSVRELFIFGSATTIYGIIFDASSNSWGSPVLIRATSVNTCAAILSAANQILVTSCDTTTGFQGVTLTITGTSITVNTAASVVLAGNISTFGNLVALGTSWVQGYSRATTTIAIRALSISGTTVTIGSEAVQTPAVVTAPILLVTGSNLRVVSTDNTTLIYCKPYTVAGVVLTPGTQASSATNTSALRAFVNGNGNVVVETYNSNHIAIIFKLTGTVEAASTATLDASTLGGIAGTGYIVISTSKTLFVAMDSGNSYFNILIDTAGTASVGTTITSNSGVVLTSPLCSSSVVSNIARVAGYNGSLLTSYNIDCSGTSAIISSTKSINSSSNFGITSQDKYGVLSGGSYCLSNVDYAIYYGGASARITANSLSRYTNYLPGISNSAYKGKSDSISWYVGQATSTTGISFQRIEVVA